LISMSESRKRKINYNLTVFVICLGIAAFTWMLIKLSDNYTVELSFPVVYENQPENMMLVEDVDSTIQVGLDAQGFVIVKLKYFSRKAKFHIDLGKVRLKKHGREYYAMVNTREWAQETARKYDVQGGIVFIRPDTIAFRFEKIVSKHVKVIPDLKFTFAKQYFPYDSLRLEPDRCKISGLAATIDTISAVQTEKREFDNLSQNLNEKVRIRNPLPGQLFIDPSEVAVTMPVEKFTESELFVPVLIRNNNKNLRVKVFPDKVKIVFMVALKDFRKVSPEMFTVSVDLSKADLASGAKLPVSIDTHPAFTKIKSMEPSEVDYLIFK